MQKINPVRWIFIIQFIFIQSFVLKAQVLDATFSSPTQSVCAGSYYTINANTSTYSYSSYNWSISGLQNASYSISGSSITIFAMSPGSCNVTLTVSEGGSTQTHTENNFLR